MLPTLFLFASQNFRVSPCSVGKHVTYTGPFGTTRPSLFHPGVCVKCLHTHTHTHHTNTHTHLLLWHHKTFVFHPGVRVYNVTYTVPFGTTEPSFFNTGVWVYNVTYSVPFGAAEPSFFTLECGYAMLPTRFLLAQQNLFTLECK